MTVELRKGTHSINVLNVFTMRNDEDKIILAPMPLPNEDDVRPLHVYIDSVHIFSSLELVLYKDDISQTRIFID